MTRSSSKRVSKRLSKKTKEKANGAPSGASNGIELDEAQKHQLLQIDSTMGSKKLELANAIVIIDKAERDKSRLLREIRKDGEAFEAAIREIAQEHGIDPDGKEGWRLELKSMTLFPRGS